jgi:uncharacterized protein YoxC
MANDISYRLNVATKDAEKNLKAAAKEAKKLGTDLDDTRTAGKKAADFLSKFADDAQADFKANAKAAEKLAEALGSEFVAELNASGRSVDDLVDDLKRMGLTAQDVEDSVDDLAPALKKTADVGKQIDTHITKNLKGVAEEADKSKSVMANAMGNMSQEIPGVAEAFGPLNTAVGQFAEYAAEGGISMGGLVKAAGPIAVVGLAIGAVTSIMAKQKKVQDAMKRDLETLQSAYEDTKDTGTSTAKALAAQWKEAGRVTAVINGSIVKGVENASEEFKMTIGDMETVLTDELDRMNISAEEFAKMALGPKEAVDKLALPTGTNRTPSTQTWTL